MKSKDKLQRFIFENISVRGEWVHLDESYQTIVNQHQYPKGIRELLGETLVAANLLSATIKFKGRLTLQFQGKDKLKLLMAQCNHEFGMRGLAQWQGEVRADELSGLLKEGLLVVTIDPDDSTKRYQGIVEWRGDHLAQSIEGYFKDSEQLPTRIWIAVNENSATGLLLQAVPKSNHTPELDKNDWEHLIHLTETITPEELLSLDAQTLLQRLYVEEEVRLFDAETVRFECNCSLQRSENALLILGREEVEQELKDKQRIVVTCEFCSNEYSFDRADVVRIFNKGSVPPSSTQLH